MSHSSGQSPPIIVLSPDRPPVPDILQGFRSYLERYGLGWPIVTLARGVEWRLAEIMGESVALLGYMKDDLAADQARRCGAFSVTWLNARPTSRCPHTWHVGIDDGSVGAQAVDHLLAAGYEHLAYWGNLPSPRTRRRYRGAAERAEALGYGLDCLTHPKLSGSGKSQDEGQVLATLEAMPRPLGLIALQHSDAQFLQSFLSFYGLRLPQEIGIVGVDDDVTAATTERLGLSSVRMPWQRVGEGLAEVWHHLVSGSQCDLPPRQRSLPAYGVTGRASTALRSQPSSDPLVHAFLKRVRKCSHLREGIADYAAALGVARTTLYQHVERSLGRSPIDLLHDRRIEQACKLLEGTGLDLSTIARRCGYASPQRLHAAFTARYPVPPGMWRRR